MLYKESETVELKTIVVESIKKEIIAFANCAGGKLYIGVQDDGTVVGVEDPDGAALQISNMVRDGIKPDITMFLRYETLTEGEKQILLVDVQRGTGRPYYIAKKGMRPEGVYVRQGYASVPATDTAIRRMIKETDGDSFEARRSLNQALSFDVAKKEFALRNVEFGAQQMRTLKLLDNDGLYSNLAMLLSEQCLHTIKVAVFQGNDQTVFKDRREFTGSLLQQMNDVYDYIDLYNRTRAVIKRLIRIDTRDYPEVAVREALLNLLVHRDYSFSASCLISIYEDRIEFLSIGGLMPGIELEDVMAGISVCRNMDLANVFYRLHLIEAYGTGIGKVMGAYSDLTVEPKITVTNNTFKITLPNVNKQDENYTKKLMQSTKSFSISEAVHSDDYNDFDEDEKQVLHYVREKQKLRRKDVVELLDVSESTAVRLIRRLEQKGLLERHGKARNTYYSLAVKYL